MNHEIHARELAAAPADKKTKPAAMKPAKKKGDETLDLFGEKRG